MATKEPPANSNGATKTPAISRYEQSREERIKENLQRLQQLGIMDLSRELNSSVPPKRASRKPSSFKRSSPLPSPGPLRRSSRLQKVTPVKYSEAALAKGVEDEGVKLEEGSKPEVYTEEHEKLLGNTERSWTLFVDGYGREGRRIYDPVKGKTCHQCRQKTLGHRTQCSKCNMVQGQFCGDCLFMRYGENVLDAIKNPNWVCPVCRGICNCSLCRQAKGWPPTGPLYRKISQMGFKSVAHYLIQTRREQTNVPKNPYSISQAAKRSLSFPDSEEPLIEESSKSDNEHLVTLKPQSEGRDDELNIEKENKKHLEMSPATRNPISSKKPKYAEPDFQVKRDGNQKKDFAVDGESNSNIENKTHVDLNVEVEHRNKEPMELNLQATRQGLSEPCFEDRMDNVFEGKLKKELHFTDDNDLNSKKENKTCIEPKTAAIHQLSVKPSGSADNSEFSLDVNGKSQLSELDLYSKKDVGFKIKHERGLHFTDKEHNIGTMTLEDSPNPRKKRKFSLETNLDSIGRRLRHRRKVDSHSNKVREMNEKGLDAEQSASNILSEKGSEKEGNGVADNNHGNSATPTSHQREADQRLRDMKPSFEASPDSIAGRLRQRRREGKDSQ